MQLLIVVDIDVDVFNQIIGIGIRLRERIYEPNYNVVDKIKHLILNKCECADIPNEFVGKIHLVDTELELLIKFYHIINMYNSDEIIEFSEFRSMTFEHITERYKIFATNTNKHQ